MILTCSPRSFHLCESIYAILNKLMILLGQSIQAIFDPRPLLNVTCIYVLKKLWISAIISSLIINGENRKIFEIFLLY